MVTKYSKDEKKGLLWNIGIGVISIFNIIAILYYYFTNYKSLSLRQINMSFLVIIYVIVCAVRSIWPRVDGKYLCCYDNFISTPLVGRILATMAEISFGLFIIMVSNDIIKSLNFEGSEWILVINTGLVFMITVAQIFCWVGIVTKDPSYNAIEESLWTVFGLSNFLIYFYVFTKLGNSKNSNSLRVKKIIPLILFGTLCYVTFMVVRDVPMYIKNAKNYKGKYNNLTDGIKKLSKCIEVTHSYKRWKEDIPWLTGYFTVTVWCSILILKWHNKYF